MELTGINTREAVGVYEMTYKRDNIFELKNREVILSMAFTAEKAIPFFAKV
jgi:hypothetical protein